MAIRLSQAAWAEIKRLYVAGHGAVPLAQRFSISAETIHKRSSKERWRNELPVTAVEPPQDSIADLAAAVRQLATAVATQNQVEEA